MRRSVFSAISLLLLLPTAAFGTYSISDEVSTDCSNVVATISTDASGGVLGLDFDVTYDAAIVSPVAVAVATLAAGGKKG